MDKEGTRLSDFFDLSDYETDAIFFRLKNQLSTVQFKLACMRPEKPINYTRTPVS